MNKEGIVIRVLVVAMIITLGFIIILILYEKNNQEKSIEPRIIMKNSSDFALTLSDLPQNWSKVFGKNRPQEFISEYQTSLGWKEGYEVLFNKDNNGENYVYQLISVYPLENTSAMLNTRVFPSGIRNHWLDEFKEDQNVVLLEELEVGEDSLSYKLVSESGFTVYYISFIKNKFYVELSGRDYELMKSLAIKTDERIV